MFFKTISVRKAVNKNERENKIINFLSRLLIPGCFRSSSNTTIPITKIQIKIELPLSEKNEKKELKRGEWGMRVDKNWVMFISKLFKIVNII
jgi:hypothetical protein